MSRTGLPNMPWGVWFKVHAGAIFKAVPMALTIGVEARDLFNRGAWDVASYNPQRLEDGDVLLICNRWYTLPGFRHAAYSLLTKAMLKTVWDDVAVVVKIGNLPHVLIAEYDSVKCTPLHEFLEQRAPRGLALRKLNRDGSGLPAPNPVLSERFLKHAASEPVLPWTQFSSAYRGRLEQKYVDMAIEVSIFEQTLRRNIREGHTTQMAIAAAEQQKKDLHVYLANMSKHYPPVTEFKLFNASLVASFLATHGMVDKMVPSPVRYCVADFCHDMPMQNCVLEDPIVIFRS